MCPPSQPEASLLAQTGKNSPLSTGASQVLQFRPTPPSPRLQKALSLPRMLEILFLFHQCLCVAVTSRKSPCAQVTTSYTELRMTHKKCYHVYGLFFSPLQFHHWTFCQPSSLSETFRKGKNATALTNTTHCSSVLSGLWPARPASLGSSPPAPGYGENTTLPEAAPLWLVKLHLLTLRERRGASSP